MPVLPAYSSRQNISTRPNAPYQNESSEAYRNEQNVIGALKGMAQAWSDANDVMQYTEAKAKYEVGANEVFSRASLDPDFKNSEKYIKELNDLKTNSVQGISNQAVAAKLNAEMGLENQLTAIKIDTGFKKKQLEYNKVMVASNLDTLQQKRLSSVTAAERAQYDDLINTMVEDNLNSGVITAEEAQKIKYESLKTAATNAVYANPIAGLEMLKNETGLSDEDKYKLMNEARQIQKRDKDFADWQLKQTQTQGVIDLSMSMYDKTLTPEKVRDMQQRGIIDTDTAAIFDSIAINKKYDIPETTSLGQPEYFLRLLESSRGNKTQIDKVLKDAAVAYGDKKIGVNQYLYFVQNAKETFDRQSKGVFTPSKTQQAVYNALDGVSSFVESFTAGGAGKKGGNLLVEMIGKFFDRYTPGGDPAQIKTEIINEKIVEEKPELANFPPEGKVMVDKNGNKARVFPDGRIEEIK